MADRFRVVAIVAAYNEADIIEQSVADLIAQGVSVYLLDDGSTDGTADLVEGHLGRGVIGVERIQSAAGTPHVFALERIVEHKARLADTLAADWFINHDADEFRESPWPGLSLRDAIQRVDALGFNAIDFLSLDFWPIDDQFRAGDDVRRAFPYHAPPTPHDRLQIRCWKKTAERVDLASSAGHEAAFAGRSVFPVRFVARHYPVRGRAHGYRKVFGERRRDYADAERERGWHVQYDRLGEDVSFVRDPATLVRYDADAIRMTLMLRHRTVEALESTVDELRCVSERLGRDLDARAHDIDWLKGALEDTDAHLKHRFAEAAALRVELERTLNALADARADVEAIARDRDRHAAELAAAAAAADAQQRTIESQQQALAETAERAIEAARRAEAARLDAEHHVAGAERRVQDAERRIDALHRSLSWRITAPARAILRAIRGR